MRYEKQSKTGNHADHCRGDGGQRCGQVQLAVGGLHQRATGQYEDK